MVRRQLAQSSILRVVSRGVAVSQIALSRPPPYVYFTPSSHIPRPHSHLGNFNDELVWRRHVAPHSSRGEGSPPNLPVCASSTIFHPTTTLLQSSNPPSATGPNPTSDVIQKALSRLQKAEADVLEVEHIIKCFKESIGKGRNLTADEYEALRKGAAADVNFSYVSATTTLETFSKAEAEQKLERAKQEIKEAELKLEKTEGKSGAVSLDMFKGNPDVIDATLPSMPSTLYAMGELPDVCALGSKMKEVAVVKISNPYFDDIPALYVRMRYYPPLWDSIRRYIEDPPKENTNMIIVIGQPGIGKSVGFGNYCVLRCMADLPKTIIIVVASDKVNVLVPRGDENVPSQYTFDASEIRDAVCDLIEALNVRDHNVLVVHDVKSAKGTTELKFQGAFLLRLRKFVARVHTVVLTSPQKSNYGLAMKAGPFVCKYLPVWSREELECAKSFDVQSKYEYCGGVPRSYNSEIESISMAQENASSGFDPTHMRRKQLSGQCPSELVKLDIGPNYTGIVGLSPVSMSAERVLRKSFFSGLSFHYHVLVQDSSGTEKGLELENWFMFWIRGSVDEAITCDIENVTNGVKSTLTVSPQRWVQAEGNTFQGLLQAAQQINLKVGQSVFVQPKRSNFPVVDLLLFTKVDGNAWEVDAFQVTVSTSHSPKKDSASKLNDFVSDGSGCTMRYFIWVGLSAGLWSADSSCGVSTEQKVVDGSDFFVGKQYRLDMAQLAPKTTMFT